jgi:PhnB protein
VNTVKADAKDANNRALTPHIVVKGAAKAIQFYVDAFEASEIYRLSEPGSGKIGHAELAVGDGKLMLADEYPDWGALSPTSIGGSPVSMHLYVDDVDAVVERATRFGATVLRQAKDEFFGDRVATIVDPFGHRWQLATRKENVAPAEMQKRWTEMMG